MLKSLRDLSLGVFEKQKLHAMTMDKQAKAQKAQAVSFAAQNLKANAQSAFASRQKNKTRQIGKQPIQKTVSETHIIKKKKQAIKHMAFY